MARKSYPAGEITVFFDPARCIHARECVVGLPDVFDTGKRPWIQPENSDAESVTEVVLRCPSGALNFEREDGVREVPQAKNVVSLVVDGPLYARGDIEVRDTKGKILYQETRTALCRCGSSGNKPFCDNTHKEAGFVSDGSPGDPTLTIIPTPNGPLLLGGEVEIRAADGGASRRGTGAALCRCGRSANKPLCDGSHARTGWRENP